MRNINLSDLLNIFEYEKVREEYRSDIMSYKNTRRVELGPHLTLTFENMTTMKFQIQEMMRAERMVHDAQIQEEIDIYNSLLPTRTSLSATLFIEITQAEKIKPVLRQFIGLTVGDTVYLSWGENIIFAEFESGREEEDRISSVHYIHFSFDENLLKDFLKTDQYVIMGVDYNDYNYKLELPNQVLQSLRSDFDMYK